MKGFLPATGLSKPTNYIMPVIALSGSSMAFITRLTRSKLIDVLKSDYIRTAKAKGLSGRTIVFKHALRNSTYSSSNIFRTFSSRSINRFICSRKDIRNSWTWEMNLLYLLLIEITHHY